MIFADNGRQFREQDSLGNTFYGGMNMIKARIVNEEHPANLTG
jgi:hypothetical protein